MNDKSNCEGACGRSSVIFKEIFCYNFQVLVDSSHSCLHVRTMHKDDGYDKFQNFNNTTCLGGMSSG